MNLRPYQQRAVDSVVAGWEEWKSQLGVAATGAGKTVIFSHLAAGESGRTLILAHRQELVNQAVEKLHAATGIFASVEQGNNRAMPGHGVIVASVQSMARRLAKYAPDAFDLVICDEAHHALSSEWRTVIDHFSPARLLGVTATPDRSDRRSLGKVFQRVAFEIGLLELIGEGHLVPLRACKLEIEVDVALRSRLRKSRDVSEDEASEAVAARIEALARSLAAEVWDRKALIFLPRCDVSEHFAELLRAEGIDAKHIAGDSPDRAETLAWFAQPGPKVLCNAMLLTEGYDQPDIDAICCLRPTTSRSLYAQIIGRGTRTAPGKDHCLILDPLWLSGELNLCKPADLVAAGEDHREILQRKLEEGKELTEAELEARAEVEERMAERLREARRKKAPKGLVDPLAWAVGIHDSDLVEWEAVMPWEEEPATAHQVSILTTWGLWTEGEGMTRGFASKLLDRVILRDKLGLATPKQVMKLKQLGEPNADVMTKAQAGAYLGRRFGR
jgi:superfamily II DNA or RNA helicase